MSLELLFPHEYIFDKPEFLASYKLFKNFKWSNMTWFTDICSPGKVRETAFGGHPELCFFF